MTNAIQNEKYCSEKCQEKMEFPVNTASRPTYNSLDKITSVQDQNDLKVKKRAYFN